MWISAAIQKPKAPGVYMVKYKDYNHGELVGEGETMQFFDDERFEAYASGDKYYYRDFTHWMPICYE